MLQVLKKAGQPDSADLNDLAVGHCVGNPLAVNQHPRVTHVTHVTPLTPYEYDDDGKDNDEYEDEYPERQPGSADLNDLAVGHWVDNPLASPTSPTSCFTDLRTSPRKFRLATNSEGAQRGLSLPLSLSVSLVLFLLSPPLPRPPPQLPLPLPMPLPVPLPLRRSPIKSNEC